MKKKTILLPIFVLSSVMLSSCGLFDFLKDTINFDVKSTSLYHLDPEKEGSSKDDIKVKDIGLFFVPNQPLIPYVSVSQYFEYIPLRQGYKIQTASGLVNDIVVVSNKEDEPTFALSIDYSQKTVMVAGSLTGVVDNGKGEEIDDSTLKDNLFVEYDIVAGSSNANTYSWDSFGIDSYRYKQKNYLPISFLDLNVSKESGTYFFYNNKSLYRYFDYSIVENYSFTNEDGHQTTVLNEYKHAINNQPQPHYLVLYNLECYMYMMQNMYGLRYSKNISDWRKYLISQDLYYGMLDEKSPETRGLYYSNSINKLNDDHSGLISSILANVYGETVSRERGDISKERKELLTNLTNSRHAVYEEKGLREIDGIIYSEDGESASFIFDSFNYDKRENVEKGIYEKDAFALLQHQFNILKEKEVKNVFIDISTNGGGALYVMFKILALTSKDNLFNTKITDYNAGLEVLYHGGVDINNDEVYNAEDCYGDDFNIYLITSACSFSCGNAYPYIARKMNNVTLMGKRTGGGECAVETNILPNLQVMQYSSNLHIGYQGYGFEDGIQPDIELEYNEFYDIETLVNKIKA